MIAVITYDATHLKTQDLISKLILNGYSSIHLVAIPWIERKNFLPILKHRPSKKVSIIIDEMCERMNLQSSRVDMEKLNDYFF